MAGTTIISGSLSNGVTLSSPAYGNPVTVTGTIKVNSGYGLIYPSGTTTNWTVDNTGTIAASSTGTGVLLGSYGSTVASGSVTNSGGGVIYGGAHGVYVYGYGTVTNIGTSTISSQTIGVDIRQAGTVSNLSGGVINGANSAAVYIYGYGKGGAQSHVQVFNAGTLTGYSGVAEFLGGSVTNASSGTIVGSNKNGVFLDGSGSVNNQGLISGANTGIYLYEAGSIYNAAGATIFGDNGVVAFGGTVTNAGTIDGIEHAVDFVAYSGTYFPSQLIVMPSAMFVGYIGGGQGTLELASGSSAGSLSGIGTSITNFNAVTIGAGAAWNITGNATGLGAIGTIAGFTANDTIDLTDFIAVGETFTDNKLVLSDTNSATATLNIHGSFTTSNFRIAPDNSSGTDITMPQTLSWIGGNGDWTTGTNWSKGTVPGGVDTAIIANTGSATITVASGDSIAIANATLGTTGKVLEVDGTFTASGTLTINAGQLDLSHTGTISGGTITDTTGAGFTSTGGTLDGVTYQRPLNIASSGGRLVIVNGLTVAGPSGSGPGTINLTEGSDAIIDFLNSQTIDTATINLNGTDSTDPLTEIQVGGTGSTLTLGANLTVSSTAMNTKAGIQGDGSAQTSVLNEGSIVAAAAHDGTHQSSFVIAPADGFTNQGSIAISNGELFSIQPGAGVFDNPGQVSVSNASTLQISGIGTTVPISNPGTISLASGALLDLTGFFTPDSLGGLVNNGATTQIDGTFDAEGNSVTLGSGTLLNAVALAGQIRNATIDTDGSLTIDAGDASLLNDTYQGVLTVASKSTGLTLFQGVTVTDASGNQPGTIDITGQSDTLAFANEGTATAAQGQTFDNVLLNIGNPTGADVIAPGFSGGTFTIGSNADIVSSTTGALVDLNAGATTTVTLNGTVSAVAQGGTFVVAGAAGSKFSNNGTMMAGNGGTLSVTSAIITGTGNGTIDIGTGGVADFAASVASDQTVAFADSTGTLMLQQPGSFDATISGMVPGDTIDLVGIAATTALWSAGSPGSLAIANNGTLLTLMSILGDYTKDAFVVTGQGASGTTITVTATCFGIGTRILTPGGEVPVEELRVGGLVITISGRVQPIHWIGRRHVEFSDHPNRSRVLPVLVTANAFARGRPRRNLLLSPDHAVFIDNVLIPIRFLVNGTSVTQICCQAITYYHIELPHHDVLLAEGLPAESYLEAGARTAFDDCTGAIQLHPDFAPRPDQFGALWEAKGYAPLVVAGTQLERVRRRLARDRRPRQRAA